MPGHEFVGRSLHRLPWRQRPLAEPPAGSGLKAVPGIGGAPLIGRTPEIIFDGPNFSDRIYASHGPISWVSAFGMKFVTALGPDATQAILVNADKAYSQ